MILISIKNKALDEELDEKSKMIEGDEKNDDKSFADNSKIEESFTSPENVLLRADIEKHAGMNKLALPIAGGSKNKYMTNLNDTANKDILNSPIEKRNPQSMKQISPAKEELDIDDFNQRTKKLLSSKGNNKKSVILQFSFFALIYITLFIIDYVIEIIYLTNLQVAYTHLQLASSRSPNIRFSNLFTLEEILQGTDLTYSGNIISHIKISN